MFKVVGRAALLASLVLGGVVSANALPLGASSGEDTSALHPVQYRPGHYRSKYYRREMRRYRRNPGARFELRQNRRSLCQTAPSRCWPIRQNSGR